MKEEKYQVGTSIEDGDKNKWVIGAKYKNGKWLDLELYNRKSGKVGYLRVKL